MFLALYVKRYFVADKADTKRGDRYIYTLFIIVAELTIIAASQTSLF